MNFLNLFDECPAAALNQIAEVNASFPCIYIIFFCLVFVELYQLFTGKHLNQLILVFEGVNCEEGWRIIINSTFYCVEMAYQRLGTSCKYRSNGKNAGIIESISSRMEAWGIRQEVRVKPHCRIESSGVISRSRRRAMGTSKYRRVNFCCCWFEKEALIGCF